MAENSKIEWTHHTFNPWVGCTKVSPACDHCYAEGWAKRSGMVQWGPHAERRRTSESNWRQPIKWNAEAERHGVRYRVFCASLADVFDNAVPTTWRVDLFRLIEKTPNLAWLLLTKRIGNAANMMFTARGGHLPLLQNVWIGATICNQEEAERDIPKLMAVPAAKRFLSIEPLLGTVDIARWLDDGSNEMALAGALDWIVVGGESGPGARPMHPEWAQSLRDQCAAADVPFFFKQWGEWIGDGNMDGAALPAPHITDPDEYFTAHNWGAGISSWRVGKKAAGRLLDGRLWDEVPA